MSLTFAEYLALEGISGTQCRKGEYKQNMSFK